MSISDALNAYPKADEPQYVPKTEFDGVSGHIQTGGLETAPADYTELLEQFGYDPTQVRIVGHPRTSRWQTYDERWLTSYRFNIAPVSTVADTADLEAIIQNHKPKVGKAVDGGSWFIFQAGDLQIGKRSRDGSTEQIVERYLQSVEDAVAELKACKRLGIAGVQISMPGDMCEGNQSQSGRNLWLTQETITEQARIMRRLMLHTVEAFAFAPHVYLDVVNGNHDQAQRQQNTYPGDGWATESAIAVSDALTINDAYSHVEVRVPDKWSGMMTVPVGDTAVCIAHGHQWRQEGNVWKWWSDQAINHQPAGAAQLLQSGHFHSWRVTCNEHKTHIQSPTLDCGSDWFREVRGGTSKRGAVVYLLKSGEVSRMSVV